MEKFLKVYQGRSSGSFMGRDDGYPETKYIVYTDIRSLALDFGKDRDERHFTLEPMSDDDLKRYVDTELAAVKQEKEAEQRRKDEAEFERLKNKLGN